MDPTEVQNKDRNQFIEGMRTETMKTLALQNPDSSFLDCNVIKVLGMEPTSKRKPRV